MRRVLVSEAARAGVAVIEGAALGIFRDIEDGCRRLVKLGEPVVPDTENHRAYLGGYRKYVDLCERLVPLFL